MFSKKPRSKSGSAVMYERSAKLPATSTKARAFSMPIDWRRGRAKGIMKYITHDESIHSTYGSERGGSKEKENAETCKTECAEGVIQKTNRLKFADILIREYDRTIGDNPSCSSGPPIGISWEYSQANTISIDQYEDNRPPRRSHFEMILPRTVRQDMLRKEWDVTQTQIANAVRNNIKIKNQRRATVGNLGKASKFEELLEKTQRGLKRGIFFQKSTSQQAADLRKQLEDMERMRAEVYGAADEDKDEEEYGTEDNPIDYDGPQVEEAPGSPVSVADSDVSETREHNSLSKPTMTVRVVSNIAETVGAPKSRFTTEDMTPDTDPEGLDHSDVDASF